MKITIEYDLSVLSYNQLRSMLVYLRETKQNDKIKQVNDQLQKIELKMGRSTAEYKFPELEPKKTFWQRLFGK